MRTELLDNFVTLVECGTISAAANTLHMDPGNLRKQIIQLENEFGTLYTVSRKNNHKIILTWAGQTLFEYALSYQQRDKLLHKKINYYQKGYQHHLSIAVVPGLSQIALVKYIKPLMTKYPDLSYELIETNVREQEHIILNQTAELGLSNSAIIHPEEFKIISSKPQRYHIVCSKNTKHLNIEKTSYSLKDLANVPICLTINSGERIEKAFDQYGIIPKIIGRSSLRQSTSYAAALDLGVAIYPVLNTLEDDRLVALPLQEPTLCSEEVLYTSKDHNLSPIAKAFLKIYKAQ